MITMFSRKHYTIWWMKWKIISCIWYHVFFKKENTSLGFLFLFFYRQEQSWKPIKYSINLSYLFNNIKRLQLTTIILESLSNNDPIFIIIFYLFRKSHTHISLLCEICRIFFSIITFYHAVWARIFFCKVKNLSVKLGTLLYKNWKTISINTEKSIVFHFPWRNIGNATIYTLTLHTSHSKIHVNSLRW